MILMYWGMNMQIIDFDRSIEYSPESVSNIIISSLTTYPKGSYDSFLINGFAGDEFRKIFDGIINKISQHASVIKIPASTRCIGSIKPMPSIFFSKTLSRPFPITVLQIRSYPNIAKVLLIVFIALLSLLFNAFFVIKNPGPFFSISVWSVSYLNNLLPNLLYSAFSSAIISFVYLLSNGRKIDYNDPVISKKINNIAYKNNGYLLKKYLNFSIKHKKNIFLIIEDIESLKSKSELEFFEYTLKTIKEHCKVVTILYSPSQSARRTYFIQHENLKIKILNINCEKADPMFELPGEYLKKINFYFKLKTWNEWSLFCFISKCCYFNNVLQDVDKLENMLLENVAEINTICRLFSFHDMSSGVYGEIFKIMKSNKQITSLFTFGENSIRVSDKIRYQAKYLTSQPENIIFNLLISCIWLLILLKSNSSDVYTTGACNEIIVDITSMIDSVEPSLKSIFSEFIQGFSTEILKHADGDLSTSFGKLCIILMRKYDYFDQMEILKHLTLFLNCSTSEYKEQTAGVPFLKKFMIFHIFNSTIGISEKKVNIEARLPLNATGLDPQINGMRNGKFFYTNFIIMHSFDCTIFDEYPTTADLELNIQNYLINNFDLGSFNFSSLAFLPVLTGCIRLNFQETIKFICKHFEHGILSSCENDSIWTRIWKKSISFIIISECLIVLSLADPDKQNSSYFNFYERITTKGQDYFVDLINMLLDYNGIKSKIRKESSIPVSFLGMIHKKLNELELSMSISSFWYFSYLIKFHTSRYCLYLKDFYSLEKEEKEDVYFGLSIYMSKDNPLMCLYFYESFFEVFGLDWMVNTDLGIRHLPHFLSFSNDYINDNRLLVNIKSKCANFLQSSSRTEYWTLACRILLNYHTFYKKNYKNHDMAFIDKIKSVDRYIILGNNLRRIGKKNGSRASFKFANEIFDSILRPSVGDGALFVYLNTQIALLYYSIDNEAMHERSSLQILELLESTDPQILTLSNIYILLDAYFTYVYPKKKFDISSYLSVIYPSADSHDNHHLFLLLNSMCDILVSEKNLAFASVIEIFFNCFFEGNLTEVDPESILCFAKQVSSQLELSVEFDSFRAKLDILVKVAQKRILIKIYRQSLPVWVTNKQIDEISTSFYNIYEFKLNKNLSKNVILASEEKNLLDRANKFLNLLETANYDDVHISWERIYLIKEVDIIARKFENKKLQSDVKRLWTSLKITCVDSLLKLLDENTAYFDIDKDMVEIIQKCRKVIRAY